MRPCSPVSRRGPERASRPARIPVHPGARGRCPQLPGSGCSRRRHCRRRRRGRRRHRRRTAVGHRRDRVHRGADRGGRRLRRDGQPERTAGRFESDGLAPCPVSRCGLAADDAGPDGGPIRREAFREPAAPADAALLALIAESVHQRADCAPIAATADFATARSTVACQFRSGTITGIMVRLYDDPQSAQAAYDGWQDALHDHGDACENDQFEGPWSLAAARAGSSATPQTARPTCSGPTPSSRSSASRGETTATSRASTAGGSTATRSRPDPSGARTAAPAAPAAARRPSVLPAVHVSAPQSARSADLCRPVQRPVDPLRARNSRSLA